ncbi:MAG: hypothetical protein P4L84_29330 [Isosphaeraceae bacterium]|nr:hypothetical protein [Isosphaeraceae bacterium]
MIGHIRFNYRGAPTLAVLQDDGRWECTTSRSITDNLKRDFSPIGKPSASGNWGHWELLAAAYSLRGLAQLGPPAP